LRETYSNNYTSKARSRILVRALLAIYNTGRRLLVSAFSLLLNFILINYYPEDVLNTYVYFVSIYGLFYVFTNWGSKFFITKQISSSPKDIKHLVTGSISSKLLLCVLASLIIIVLPLELGVKILMILFLLLKSLTPIFNGLIIYTKTSQTVFIVELFFNVLFLAYIFFNQNTISPFTFILFFVLLELLKSLYYFYKFWGELSLEVSLQKGLTVLKTSIYFFGVSFAGFIASKSDFYIVGILIDQSTMSHYFIISSLSAISMVIYASLINTFETSIYRFSKSVFKKLEDTLRSFGMFFSILSTAGFYVAINYFYNIPVDIKFTILFLVNIYIFTLLNFEMYRFTKLEKQKIILLILIFAGIINLGLSFILIKKYILFGAFMANTISLLCNYVLLRLYLKKYLCNEV